MTAPGATIALQSRTAPPAIFRWVVLVFISMAMFGNYYVYDSISPLADVLARQLGFTDSNIGLLNAIYSTPNIFMVLVGGILIDRFGTKKSLFLFAFLCLLGAAITASYGTLAVMAAGRLVFGLGAESMLVAINSAIAKWFRGKELSFAFGLSLTLARLGSFAAFNSPSWAREAYQTWQGPLLIAAGAGVLCAAAAAVYWLLEAHAERNYELGRAGQTDKVTLSETFRFGVSYWYVVALCITFYSAIFPFQTFAIKFFIDAHDVPRETAGFLVSMLTLFAMVCTPLFGLLVDHVGRRSLFMMFGSALLVPVYLIMAYTSVSLYLPMAMMGIAFSLIPAVMWPSVAYLVESNRLGTAYGLMTMVQNIGLAAFNLLIGAANDYAGASSLNPEGYRLGMWIFSSLGLFGLLFSYLLRRRETGPEARGLETIKTGNASL
ncbi:MAG TPA: MFS transporter [Acidobacteriota bacterium]|nr:MFS transporter [Acidobacteriota bacterium]